MSHDAVGLLCSYLTANEAGSALALRGKDILKGGCSRTQACGRLV